MSGVSATHIPSLLAGMKVVTSGSCLSTSVVSAQMWAKPLSTFTPAWQHSQLLKLGEGGRPGPGSLRGKGKACLQPLPALPVLLALPACPLEQHPVTRSTSQVLLSQHLWT